MQEPVLELAATIPEVTVPEVTEAPTEVITTAREATVPAEREEESELKQPERPVVPPQETVPKESTPKETQPKDTEPRPTEAPATEAPETKPTEPPATEPPVTVPAPTEPETTEPTPTETVPEEPQPTEPPAEVIDTAALEAYGRSYASGTYGYNGTSACHPGTGAGYFPAATKKITTMEEGYSIVRQAIDSQYKRDCVYGYTPYEELDGKIVRCPINVSVSSTGEPNVYSITVYYGGTA